MDVSVQLAASPPAGADALAASRLDAMNSPAHTAPASAGVVRFGEAFARVPQAAAPGSNVAGVIDRLRSDFDAFRHRLGAGHEPQLVNAGARSEASQLTDAMNLAMRAQVDIFDMSVAFHAGLTASQQSQSGVKTLIEKS